MLHLFDHQYLFLKCITEFLHWNYHWVFLWFCRLYSDGLALGVWFMTSCCCLVEFGFSCFNHASIESWFANYSVLDILHTPLRSARCFSRRHRRALEKQGQKKQTKHSKQQDNTSMTVTVLVPGIRLFNFFDQLLRLDLCVSSKLS